MNWAEFTGQDVDSEIKKIYFEFKPGFRYSGERAYLPNIPPLNNLDIPTPDEMMEVFESQFVEGDEIAVTISYGGSLKRYSEVHELGWVATGTGIETTPLNTTEIRNILATNPWYYYANSRHVDYTVDNPQFQLYDGTVSAGGIPTPRSTPICSVACTVGSLGVTALMDNGTTFEPIYKDGNLKVTNEIISTSDTSGGSVIKYDYTLHFKYKGIKPSLVNELSTWYSHYYQDRRDIPISYTPNDEYREELITSQVDTKIKKELVAMMYDSRLDYENPTINENALYLSVPNMSSLHWNENTSNTAYKSVAYSNYLKVQAIKEMKKREFVKMLGSKLDTDYTVEKASWWEKIAMIAIIIIAVVVAVLNPPSGAAIAAAGGAGSTGATLLTIAMFTGTMTLVLSIGAMILSRVGGLSAQGLVRQLGKFAAVLGIVATVTGILSFISNFANQAAESKTAEMAGKAGAEFATEAEFNAAVEGVRASMSAIDYLSYAIDVVKTVVSDAISTVTSALSNTSTMSLSQTADAVMDTLKLATKGYEYVQDQEAQKLKDETEKLKAEEEKYNEEIQNRPYVQAAGVYELTHERLSSYDCLQEMAIMVDSKIGRDHNYSAWDADVNS